MIRTRWLTAALATCLVAFGAVATAEDAPDNWDGLVQIKPKRMDLVYVLPGTDFRPYTKVMLDKTEVAFHKDWLKNMNDTRSVSRRIDETSSADECPWKGRRPLAISYRMTPSEKRSVRWSISRPETCSGDM